MLVQNDDRFVAASLRNALPFCDHFLVMNNQSTDNTRSNILKVLDENPDATIELIDLHDVQDSHKLLEPYAGKNWWIFAVDGDEIYDPKGLVTLRDIILSGKHQNVWQLYGHVLHVTRWSPGKKTVSGHESPPAHPMTKLYNFSLVESWTGCPQRLHGGKLVLNISDEPEKSRFVYFHHYGWEESPFKCLHMVFLKRSSKAPTLFFRSAPIDTIRKKICSQSLLTQLKLKLHRQLLVFRRKTGKDNAYRRGPVVTYDATAFNVREYE